MSKTTRLMIFFVVLVLSIWCLPAVANEVAAATEEQDAAETEEATGSAEPGKKSSVEDSADDDKNLSGNDTGDDANDGDAPDAVSKSVEQTSTVAGATPDEARAAFMEGTRLYTDGKYDEAARKFNDAYALKPSWKLYYNIGQAEAAARRQGAAIFAFEKYLTEGGDEIPVARRDEVFREVERLRQIVGAIDLQAPAGFTIVVDGIPRGTTPLVGRLRVAASQEHVIALQDGDEVVDSRKIVVGSLEMMTLTMAEGRVPKHAASGTSGVVGPPTSAQLQAYKRKARVFKIVGWSTLGAGGGLAIIGVLAGAAAKDQKDQNNKVDCSASGSNANCAEELEKDEKAQEDLRDLAIGFVVIGAAAMIAAPIFLHVSAKNRRRAEAARSVVLPQFAHHYGGLVYQLSF